MVSKEYEAFETTLETILKTAESVTKCNGKTLKEEQT